MGFQRNPGPKEADVTVCRTTKDNRSVSNPADYDPTCGGERRPFDGARVLGDSSWTMEGRTNPLGSHAALGLQDPEPEGELMERICWFA